MTAPNVTCFFEKETATCQFIVSDPATKKTAIIDSVLDFDPIQAIVSTTSADNLLQHIQSNGLIVEWILETHCHADHLTAAQYLKKKLDGKPKVAIGKNITVVQETFSKILNFPESFPKDGRQWDVLFEDGQEWTLGNLKCKIIPTRGHTPADISYLIGNSLFCGDSLFLPDVGTARCDFPGGSTHDLWESIQNLFNTLPKDTPVYVGHDYPPGGDDGRSNHHWVSTLGEQMELNKHVKVGTHPDEFKEWRNNRDATLKNPRLLFQSLQVNLRAGNLSENANCEQVFFHIPIRVSGGLCS
ncbi:beta-lactamase-like protein [Polychytrium aggregatum]|uniref:beta-lactamase-like protein n=1 Tax=Polychytrium aggregatum TaxID=110093 RepID=UPI0022FF2494|nr:beta-lactamase-like protein [Polychytrium aggregatum]KAI9206096.1 beta-lactamase-like protein [Polychytrium aggregatum]